MIRIRSSLVRYTLDKSRLDIHNSRVLRYSGSCSALNRSALHVYTSGTNCCVFGAQYDGLSWKGASRRWLSATESADLTHVLEGFRAQDPVQLSDSIQILYYQGPETLAKAIQSYERQNHDFEQREKTERLRNVVVGAEPLIPNPPTEIHISPEEANRRLETICTLFMRHANHGHGRSKGATLEEEQEAINAIVLTDAIREVAKLVPYTELRTDYAWVRSLLKFAGDYISRAPEKVMPRLLGALAFSGSRLRKNVRVDDLINSVSYCIREQARKGKHWKWKAKDISSIAYSYGQLGKAPTDVLQILGDSATPKVASFSDKGLSNILHAFTRLGFVHETLLRELPGKWNTNLPQASPQAITTVVNAFRNTSLKNEEQVKQFLAEVLAQSLPRLDDFKTMEMINLLWGMARTNQGDESFLRVAVEHAQKRLHEFNRQDLCLLLHGIASMRLRSGTSKLLVEIADKLLPICHQLTPQQTSMVIYSCGRLRLVHRPLLDAVSNHASSIHEQFTTQGLANVSWGLAQLGWRKESLMHLLANEAAAKLKKMASSEIAMLADAVAKLQIRADFLMHNFALEGSLRVASFSMQDLGVLCYSLALSGNTRRLNLLFDAVAFSMDSRIDEVRTNDAINLLWAFSIGMYFDEHAMRQLLGRVDAEELQSESVTKAALFRLQTVLLVLEHLTPFPELHRELSKGTRDLALGALNKVVQSEVISASGALSPEEMDENTDSRQITESQLESRKLTSAVVLHETEGAPRGSSIATPSVDLQPLRSKRLRRQIVNGLDAFLSRTPNPQWQTSALKYNMRERADKANSDTDPTALSDISREVEGINSSELLAPPDCLSGKQFVESFQTELGLVADFAIPEDRVAIIAEGAENFRPLHKSAKRTVSKYMKDLLEAPARFANHPAEPHDWHTVGDGHFAMPESGMMFPGITEKRENTAKGSNVQRQRAVQELFGLGFQAGRELDEHIRLLPVLLTHHLLLEANGWTVVRIPFYRWQAQKAFDVGVHRMTSANIPDGSGKSANTFFSNPLPSDISNDVFPSQAYYLQRQLRAAYGAFAAQIVPCTV
eukprot:gb/GECG01006704.1/.p1 GENE.gb/GECG01006704.1/~~gb/GECG01006704.1/.p1  ORF type:complete len:1066 (+),score=118.78 gb/GECG01006704.1/:1-3198(+)